MNGTHKLRIKLNPFHETGLASFFFALGVCFQRLKTRKTPDTILDISTSYLRVAKQGSHS
jgi:hypothetical protein